MQEITIVTGFFDIKRGEWGKYKRTNEEYFQYFAKWCSIKNKMVVFVENDNLADLIISERKKYNLSSITKVVVVSDFLDIDINLFSSITNTMKNSIGKWFRLQPNNPEVVNPYYNYIMLLKEWCVVEAIKRGYADGMIAWIDFGFNHGGETFACDSFIGYEWKYSFPEKICLFNNHPVDESRPIFDVVRTMDVYIMGTVIVAPANLWIKLLEYVKSAMLSLCDCGLADDDQTILLMVYLKHKDNCMLFPSTWNMQLYDYCSGDNKLKLSNVDFQKHNKCNLKKFIKARKYNLSLLRYSLRQYKIMSIKGKK